MARSPSIIAPVQKFTSEHITPDDRSGWKPHSEKEKKKTVRQS